MKTVGGEGKDKTRHKTKEKARPIIYRMGTGRDKPSTNFTPESSKEELAIWFELAVSG